MNLKFIHFLLFPILIFFQNEKSSKDFDSTIYNISINVSFFDPDKAMHLADSLYAYSETENERLKSIMLKADILDKQEEHSEAIQQAFKALQLAEDQNDFSYQAKIYFFLSTQYRTIGFLDKGKALLKKGIGISLDIEDVIEVAEARAMAHREMAEYAIEEKQYEQAIAYLQLAVLSYEREDNSKFKNLHIGNTEEMLGRANMALNNSKSALEYFRKANYNMVQAHASNTAWAALVYKGFGEAFMANKKVDSAQLYYEKALVIADCLENNSLKQSVYKSVSEFFRQRKMMEDFVVYNSKFKKVLEENTAKKKVTINNAYRTLDVHPPSTFNTQHTYSIIGISFLVIVLNVGVVFINRKPKAVIPELDHESNDTKVAEFVLSQKAEEEILKKLCEFENSEDFVDKEMSLSVLIAKTNTNIKYLRKVLKKHRNKDYTNYINELRIKYIVQKLNDHPKYLTYKISYLADESGFSSHSKFSSSFKKVMTISPSEYIENMKSDTVSSL